MTFGDDLKCPGCGGKYRVIDPKCKECVKRYHKYRYETKEGLEEQYEEKYGPINRDYFLEDW